jgi:hypothetical protein
MPKKKAEDFMVEDEAVQDAPFSEPVESKPEPKSNKVKAEVCFIGKGKLFLKDSKGNGYSRPVSEYKNAKIGDILYI